jgi:hypothetical protein
MFEAIFKMTMRTSNAVMGMTNEANARLDVTTERLSALAGERPYGHLIDVTHHTSHVTRHTSHVKRHTPHVTRHTSHVTRHTLNRIASGRVMVVRDAHAVRLKMQDRLKVSRQPTKDSNNSTTAIPMVMLPHCRYSSRCSRSKPTPPC